jgi:glyoxylase-like metal-dependent hydrolase (beta-lactamase superfamily II)
MIFRQLLTPDSGCASYLLGCPRSSACAVVDPQEDIAPYLEIAARESLRITHVIETHVQADHRSGARLLASVTRAPVFLHEAAEVDFPHAGLAHEEEHELGTVRLTALHTPGHTPEGLSLLVADRRRSTDPWCVLTGDTLLAGGVGPPEPDEAGAAAALAERLYDSLYATLLALPDHVEVYPAHVGGSASRLGEGVWLGTTIGRERHENPMLQCRCREDFVRAALAGTREVPREDRAIRRWNRGLD